MSENLVLSLAFAMVVPRRYWSSIVEKCPVNAKCACDILERLPSDKKIDFARNLNGTSNIPWKHILLLSQEYDDPKKWPSKIEAVPGSILGLMQSIKRSILPPNRNALISSAILPTRQRTFRPRAFVFPDNVQVDFDEDKVESFLNRYLASPDNEGQNDGTCGGYKPTKYEVEEKTMTRGMLFICGHFQRDERCGMIAPLLYQAFLQKLRLRNLDIDVGYVSHIGGHVYAGNVIYFPPTPGELPVWYGRVLPEHVDGIIDETICRGNIIKELFRGMPEDVQPQLKD